MFRTKVCGIKTSEDFSAAIAAGIDAVGLNFAAESPRCIDVSRARELVEQVQPSCLLVGVFVNPSPTYVTELLKSIPLDYVQLHGEETVHDWIDFKGAPLIRAVRWDASEEQTQQLAHWHDFLGERLAAFLIDAPSHGARGGTGKQADWNTLVPRPVALAGKPMILAGGLTPDNVAEAIDRTKPAAVDTASGVEISPGVKDAAKMKRFAEAAKLARK
jgi:phosphoribosylanthranilate isomerase